ncbi:MAG: phosphatase PAP2 family protein [Verrucomicrobiota bacterium]
MISRVLSPLAALMLAGAAMTRGNDPDPPGPAPYFTAAALDPRSVLPNPPADNSDATEKEIEYLLQAQATRTQGQVDRAQAEAHYTLGLFLNTPGDWFLETGNPARAATLPLLQRADATAAAIAQNAQALWNRRRPFLVNSRIYPSMVRPTGPGYPSEHAVRAAVEALVLAQLAPENSQAILACGNQIGDDRVLAGVEFPSDVNAGRLLGRAIVDQLMNDASFRDGLKQARDLVKAQIKKEQL